MAVYWLLRAAEQGEGEAQETLVALAGEGSTQRDLGVHTRISVLGHGVGAGVNPRPPSQPSYKKLFCACSCWGGWCATGAGCVLGVCGSSTTVRRQRDQSAASSKHRVSSSPVGESAERRRRFDPK